MSTVFIGDSLQNKYSAMNTDRSKAAHSRFEYNGADYNQLTTAYESSWLPRAVVDRRADDCTRKWREWHDASEKEITDIEAVEKKLKLKEKVNRAIKLASLYGGSAIYMHIDAEDPMEPLDVNRVNRDDLSFLNVFARTELSPGEVERNPLSEFYNMPKWYEVSGASGGERVRIHPSRFAIFNGNDSLSSHDGFGDSELSPVLEVITQYLATAANISEMTYEAKIDVMKVAGLTHQIEAGGEEQIRNRYLLLAELKSTVRMMVIDKEGEEFEQKTLSFAGLPEVFEKFQQSVCGAAEYPAAILFGKSTGGLGSTGELELSSYYDSVSSKQENQITPSLEVLDKVLIRSALGRDINSTFYNWRSLWQMSDKERADVGKVQADTVKSLADTGLFDQDTLALAAANLMTESGTMSGLEVADDIDETGVI